MEKYLTGTKSSTLRGTQSGSRNDSEHTESRSQSSSSTRSARYQPYSTKKDERGAKKRSLLDLLPESDTPPSNAVVTKLLLRTLKDEANPITHSDLYERTEHLVSMSTGHQVSDGRGGGRSAYLKERTSKLAKQEERCSSVEQPQVLSNVRAYIDGYLAGTTDLEMKRIVTQAGGQILLSASGATHILTSQPLSGSKTQKFLKTKSRIQVQVVKPEWVFDSIELGKRRPEREYAVVKDKTTMDLHTMMNKEKVKEK